MTPIRAAWRIVSAAQKNNSTSVLEKVQQLQFPGRRLPAPNRHPSQPRADNQRPTTSCHSSPPLFRFAGQYQFRSEGDVSHQQSRPHFPAISAPHYNGQTPIRFGSSVERTWGVEAIRHGDGMRDYWECMREGTRVHMCRSGPFLWFLRRFTAQQ
jgi:hypothetical protein